MTHSFGSGVLEQGNIENTQDRQARGPGLRKAVLKVDFLMAVSILSV